MQNDLISRSALIHYLDNKIVKCNDFEERSTLRTILSVVEEQPTAYDVEKVVAELEEQKEIEEKISKECLVEFKNMHIYARNCFGVAITKVRNGGKE